jgi:hypothetical protein
MEEVPAYQSMGKGMAAHCLGSIEREKPGVQKVLYLVLFQHGGDY